MEIKFQTQQVLVPKSVYIGDRAELRCTFKTDKEIPQFVNTECFVQPLNYTQYEIKGIQLQKMGVNNYSLVISFVPWRTGNIQFPDLEFKAVKDDGSFADEVLGLVHFEPVTIVSIVEQNSISSIKDSAMPLLLPGTAYKIYGAIFFTIVLLVVFIQGLIKRKKIAALIKKIKQNRRYAKNKKTCLKALKQTKENDNLSVVEKAGEIQKNMRNYLECRFDFPFTKTLASEMEQAFYKAGIENEEKLEQGKKIGQVFVRTDYIRYRKEETVEEKEINGIFDILFEAIEILEKPEQVTEPLPPGIEIPQEIMQATAKDKKSKKGGKNA